MSDTVKLIIEIPKETINAIKDNAMFAGSLSSDIRWDVTSAIVNGTPLDDVKAEMERANRMYPYTNHGILEAIEIIDKYIGKAESEDKE